MTEKLYHFPVQNFSAHLFRLAKLEHRPMTGAFLAAELVRMGGVGKSQEHFGKNKRTPVELVTFNGRWGNPWQFE